MLRAPYVKPGTDVGRVVWLPELHTSAMDEYMLRASTWARLVGCATGLRACYAMPGSDVARGTTRTMTT
eukprot:3935242-Rhodomonas_salina.3